MLPLLALLAKGWIEIVKCSQEGSSLSEVVDLAP